MHKFKVYDPQYHRVAGPFTYQDLMDGNFPIEYLDPENCAARSDLVFLPFSGHAARDGTEIYHGDVVRLKFRLYGEAWSTIDFQNDLCIVSTASSIDYPPDSGRDEWPDTKYYKVLGNIYLNKDLAKYAWDHELREIGWKKN